MIVVLAGWTIYDFFNDASKVIAPDEADRRAINLKFGEGAPEAKAALKERFGPNAPWRDARTGLGGLIGIFAIFWMIFG